ncbi:MAG: ABC transporter permease [Candidatus Bipolaricaulia bacterium]
MKTRHIWRRLLRDKNLLIGLSLVGLVIFMVVLSFFYTPYDPIKMGRERMQGPSAAHWFGTDQFGRDILSRVITGSVNSILVGVIAVSIGLFFGILVGITAGYFGGWLDEILMRISDVIYGFPAILMAILITAILSPGIQNSMIAIGIANIPVFARLTRGSFLALKARDFVTAARALGRRRWGIIWKHIFPNSISPLLIQASSSFAVAILAEAALSYLGLGTQPPSPSWGSMLREAQILINRTIWPAIFPGLAIAVAVLGFNLLGDGLRDVLDPRISRSR